MPINIPFMAMRRGQSMAVGAGDAEEDEEDGLPRGAARMAMTFVPPHMMTRQRDTYSMVSVEGTSPGAHAKRDQLRRRTAIMVRNPQPARSSNPTPLTARGACAENAPLLAVCPKAPVAHP